MDGSMFMVDIAMVNGELGLYTNFSLFTSLIYPTIKPIWLVVSNMFYFPFHIWDVILPIDELIYIYIVFKIVIAPPTSYSSSTLVDTVDLKQRQLGSMGSRFPLSKFRPLRSRWSMAPATGLDVGNFYSNGNLLVTTGYFYGIIHSINRVFL